MSAVIPLRVAQGSELATVRLWRMPDGQIRAELLDMPAHVIESEATIAARFTKAAEWSLGASLDFMRQACNFDPDSQEGRA